MTQRSTKCCPKCFAASGGDWSQCLGSCPMPMSPHFTGAQTQLMLAENPQCSTSHYAAIVEANKDVEIYQLGDDECPACMRLMMQKHEVIADMFRSWLAAAPSDPRRALCHECYEIVEVVVGKLADHHGVTGDGCPQNGSFAQIYLHPKVVRRIAELEAALAFGGTR